MNFSQILVHLLLRKILSPSKLFESFLKRTSTTLPERYFTINELKDASFSLKMNQSTGADKISFNVIKNGFGELSGILRYDFDLSQQTGIFSDFLKVTKVTLVFKTDDLNEISNYHPISVLPCFSKGYSVSCTTTFIATQFEVTQLYSKQFGFQKDHSTEHAIAQLADQIHESFENYNYRLVIFIDLSKIFDTIDHAMLLKKVENYGIKGTNLPWFRSYLTNRKQYI